MDRLTERDGLTIRLKKGFDVGDFASQNVLHRLADYEDTEELGLLLKLPCKIGDTVYTLDSECCGDELFCKKECNSKCEDYSVFIVECTFELAMLDDVGKYIFLTKEEAEAKLTELRSMDK